MKFFLFSLSEQKPLFQERFTHSRKFKNFFFNKNANRGLNSRLGQIEK